MEVVVDGDLCAGFVVDAIHVLVESRAVAVVVVIAISNEEEGVDHLVQERLH